METITLYCVAPTWDVVWLPSWTAAPFSACTRAIVAVLYEYDV